LWFRFNKTYASVEEEERRFKVFVANLQQILLYNQAHAGRTQFGVNQFADMSEEELYGVPV